jgi:hypothetical protein
LHYGRQPQKGIDLLRHDFRMILGGEVLAPVDPANGRLQVERETFTVSKFLKLVLRAPDDASWNVETR